MNTFFNKANISEGITWLWTAFFCFLQYQGLLAPWLFNGVISADIKQCGLGVFITGLFAAIIAVIVFVTHLKPTLFNQKKETWADLERLTQIKKLRHWVLFVTAIPGTLFLLYLLVLFTYIQL